MKINLTLEVSPEDADPNHNTGLTDEADSRLVDALIDAGFEIDSGPTRLDD